MTHWIELPPPAPAGTADMQARVVDCASTAEVHSPGQAISDGVITAKVRAGLKASPVTGHYDIHVETLRAIVTLSGYVETEEVRSEAVLIACDVEGVQQVKNLLDIRTTV